MEERESESSIAPSTSQAASTTSSPSPMSVPQDLISESQQSMKRSGIDEGETTDDVPEHKQARRETTPMDRAERGDGGESCQTEDGIPALDADIDMSLSEDDNATPRGARVSQRRQQRGPPSRRDSESSNDVPRGPRNMPKASNQPRPSQPTQSTTRATATRATGTTVSESRSRQSQPVQVNPLSNTARAAATRVTTTGSENAPRRNVQTVDAYAVQQSNSIDANYPRENAYRGHPPVATHQVDIGDTYEGGGWGITSFARQTMVRGKSLKDLENAIYERDCQITRRDETIRQYQHDNSLYAQDNRQLTADVEALRRDKGRLEEEKATYQRKIEQQDLQIRKAQESVFSLRARASTRVEDDDSVRQTLKSHMRGWKPFAKDYAVASLADVSSDALNTLKRFFITQAMMAPGEDVAQDGIFAPYNRTKAPSILLNTWLARFISFRIFNRPFFCLQEEGSGGAAVSQTLEKLYAETQQPEDDAGPAQAWRAETLRLVDPAMEQRRAGEAARRERTAQRKERYYHNAAFEFDTGPARLLFRPVAHEAVTERQLELYRIIKAAGDQFSALWTQKVKIITWGLDRFQDEPFHISSRLMEPHASHKLEEHETSMDGMKVQMVVQPAVVAFGNEDGTGFDRYKIWAKAVVWLSSGAVEGEEELADPHDPHDPHDTHREDGGEGGDFVNVSRQHEVAGNGERERERA